MPELPEVETVRRVLKENLIGLKITGIDARYPKIIDDDLEYFKKSVIGKTYKDIKRLGKFLIFELDNGYIVSHLRMEGKYFYLNDSYDNKHVHVVINLSNGYRLLYQDVRKFGRMCYKNESELYNTKPLNEVGYDPINNDSYDLDSIYNQIHKKNKEIKQILLDQSIISGLGNIYVDEVLFDVRINPHKISSKISKDKVNEIILATKKILSKAIEFKGTTIRSYTSSLGVEGGFQNFLNVHTKKSCPLCKKELICDRIGGRSTYYCKDCQK